MLHNFSVRRYARRPSRGLVFHSIFPQSVTPASIAEQAFSILSIKLFSLAD
jgi:hypothetical protein